MKTISNSMKKNIVLFSVSIASILYSNISYAKNYSEKSSATYTYYRDSDGDTYGDLTVTTTSTSTTPPSGYVANSSDCFDSDKNMKPSATETCNGKDDNCNGTTDDLASGVFYRDADGDGFGDINHPTSTTCKFPEYRLTTVTDSNADCNDNYKTIYPGASEICNAKDDDCDSSIDEGVTGTVFYKDNDRDGFGATASGATSTTCQTGYSSLSTDCNDSKPLIYPGRPDGASIVALDGVDNDCNGYVDNCDGYSYSQTPKVTISSFGSGLQTESSEVKIYGYILPSKPGNSISSATYALDSNTATTMTLKSCSANGGKVFGNMSSPYKATVSSTGMHKISVKATENTGKNRTTSTPFLYDADTFTELDESDVTNVAGGMFNQGTWNILADATEAELLNSNEMETWFKSYNPIYDDTGSNGCVDAYHIKANIDNYSHSSSKVTYTVSDGKVRLYAELANVDADFSGSIYYDLDWTCGGISDTTYYDVYASADKVYASADAGLSIDENGKLQISLSNVTSGISGFDMNLEMDEWYYEYLVDIIELFFSDEDIADLLEDVLVDYVKSDLPSELEGWLNSDSMTYDVSVGDADYTVDFDYASVSIPTSTVALNMNMGYEYDPIDASYEGALTYSNTSYSTAETSPTFVLKASHNFFNSSLFALWEGDLYSFNNVTVDSQVKIASSYANLPPIVTNNSTSGYVLKTKIADYVVNLEIKSSNGVTYKIPVSFSGDVNTAVSVVINGDDISFNLDFDAVALTYQFIDNEIPLSSADKALLDRGLNMAVEELLNDVSSYISEYSINYASLPINFSTVSVKQDVSNVNMLSIEATGSYAP